MSDDVAASQPLPLARGTAEEVAVEERRRHRASALAPLIGAGLAAVKATLSWGWVGAAGIAGTALIALTLAVATRKIAAVRLRAASGAPSAFAVVFEPLDPADYRRFGARQWRRRSCRALLVIDGGRLAFRPGERGRREGWRDFSVPLTGVRSVVVRPSRVTRPVTMAFVELEGGGVLCFRALDRGSSLVAALREAGAG